MDDSILHLEIQTTNDRWMCLRMLDYYVLLLRQYGQPIRQVVLYCGQAKLRMRATIVHGPLAFACAIRDIRDWSGEELLRSGRPGDAVLAMLAETDDPRRLVHKVLTKIAKLNIDERRAALANLAALAGLRRFERIVDSEASKMGLAIDWKNNVILRRIHDEGKAEGREEGRCEILRSNVSAILVDRFGKIPLSLKRQIKNASEPELQVLFQEARRAERLDQVFRQD